MNINFAGAIEIFLKDISSFFKTLSVRKDFNETILRILSPLEFVMKGIAALILRGNILVGSNYR